MRIKKTPTILALVMASLFAPAAMSEDWYEPPVFYAGIGYSSNSLSVNGAAGASHSMPMITGTFGAHLSDSFGWEARYGAGSAMLSATGQTLDVGTLSLVGTYSYWLSDQVVVSGKLGMARNTTTISASAAVPTAQSGGVTTNGVAYGLTAEYKLDDYVGLRLSWNKFKSGVVSGTTTVPATTGANLSELDFSLAYRF